MRGMGTTDRFPGRPNLEKPLEELTQQDIMQLTREDCRRYLKEKGMRRPSWNKSQAIQQVLSLKNLFDTRTDEENKSAKENGDETPHSSLSPPEPQRSPAASSAKYLDSLRLSWLTEAQLPVLATQPLHICRQNAFSNSLPGKQLGAEDTATQLTIFYSGNVNVYDDVPPDKAKAIMLLAGGSNYFQHSTSNNSVVHPTYSPNPTTFTAIKGARQVPATVGTCSVVSTPLHNYSNCKETPITRKASLQRFLEKKKDRSRCKAPAAAPKKPLLMGMFMHPSFVHHQYWSESSKKKCTKPNNNADITTTPPSMGISSTTKHNSNEKDDSVHNSSSEIPSASSN